MAVSTKAYATEHLTLDPAAGHMWEGLIAEMRVRVYDKALSTAELTERFDTLKTKHGLA